MRRIRGFGRRLRRRWLYRLAPRDIGIHGWNVSTKRAHCKLLDVSTVVTRYSGATLGAGSQTGCGDELFDHLHLLRDTAANSLETTLHNRARVRQLSLDQVGPALDGVQRRAQFMRQIRQELLSRCAVLAYRRLGRFGGGSDVGIRLQGYPEFKESKPAWPGSVTAGTFRPAAGATVRAGNS